MSKNQVTCKSQSRTFCVCKRWKPMWKNVIMVDEKWVYSHDSETKSLLTMGLKNISQNWNMKASSVKGEGEVDCVFLFVYEGDVHHEFSSYAHNVNKQYYLKVMKWLWEAVKGKRPNSGRKKKWMLQHNNDPAHSFPSNYKWLAHKAHHTCPKTSILTNSSTNRFLLVTKN